jgi:ribose-phosphate pyrophosphokinase
MKIEYLLNSNLIRDFNKLTIVAPDANGVYRAKNFADILISKTSANIGLSLVVPENISSFDLEKMQLVGNVDGNDCIIIDDIIDSAKTIVAAAEELQNCGAKNIYVFATHGILSGNAIERIDNSKIKKIIISNTVPINKDKISDKFIVLSSATLIAETIRRIFNNESLSEVFL